MRKNQEVHHHADGFGDCTGGTAETDSGDCGKAGIPEGAISPYGQYIAKVDPMQLGVGSEMRAKLILVTAINPTPRARAKRPFPSAWRTA